MPVANAFSTPRSATLEEMMRGVQSLEAFTQTLALTPAQRLKVAALRRLVGLYRTFSSRAALQRAQARRRSEMEQLVDLQLRSRHPDPERLRAAKPSGHYLSREDIARFERDGVLGPFEVMPPDEARRLADHVERWHETEFTDKGVLPASVRESFQRAGSWSLTHSGFYQAHRKRALWDVITSPAIAQRLASLLGDDVLCWRSQFFPKRPGDRGTFWHQNSVFRETAARGKLEPPANCPLGMAQLTVWVALRDVTIANGAMRILPGSHEDARFEYMYSFAQDQMLQFLRELPPESLQTTLEAGLFSSGSFQRVQALFEATLGQIGPVFEGREVRDLTLRAGQAVLFTSLNMHASHPNTTPDQHRLALVGRYTSGDVGVYRKLQLDHIPSPSGPMPYSLARVPPIRVHGSPDLRVNPVVMTEPYAEHRSLCATDEAHR